MEQVVDNELIESTYLFCYKRISNVEEAKDLAQDILCDALKAIRSGKEFISFHSWYWRMARNKYADYAAHKRNPTQPIETMGGMIADCKPALETLIEREEISRLNQALSRLSGSHREMMIRFYLKEQSVSEIAEDLKIPVGTVKRRLFDARNSLKERMEDMKNVGKSAYAPAKVTCFYGYMGGKVQFMEEDKIARQIAVLCRKEAKSIEEMADEMGVAAVYLEPIVNKMADVELLQISGRNKYLINCCVFPMNDYVKAKRVEQEVFWEYNFGEKIDEALESVKEKILALNFYGNDFSFNYLKWIFYVFAASQLGSRGALLYAERFSGLYPDETGRDYRITLQYLEAEEENVKFETPAKSVPWSNLHYQYHTSDYGALEYANLFQAEPFPVEMPATGLNGFYMSGRDYWVNGTNIGLLMKLAQNPFADLNSYEETMAATFVKRGILKKSAEGLKVMIPIFEESVRREIIGLIDAAVAPIAEVYAESIGEKIEKILLPHVRKDQMSNFIHWDMKMFFQAIGCLFYYGMKAAKTLEIPEDYNCSAAGLYIAKY